MPLKIRRGGSIADEFGLSQDFNPDSVLQEARRGYMPGAAAGRVLERNRPDTLDGALGRRDKLFNELGMGGRSGGGGASGMMMGGLDVGDDTTANPPQEMPEPIPYVVKKGDNLWDISQRFYGDPMKFQAIADINHIEDPNLIREGKVLLIPQEY